jgi:hypothetical protein
MTLTMTTHAPAIGTLARREAWRMVRHPVYLFVLVYVLLVSGIEAVDLGLPSRDTMRSVLDSFGLMFFGIATFFAANLVASSARRARAESQLAAAPTSAQTRTLATCLGVLGPTAVAAGFATLIWLIEHVGTDLPLAQGPAALAVIPLCTLGGGLLGVAAAQWLPWPGAALIVVVAMIAWVVAAGNNVDLRWTSPWTMSPEFHDDFLLTAGSQVWHAVYLLGLGLLAGVAALLRYPSHRRPLLALGAALWIGTLAAYWAQLP